MALQLVARTPQASAYTHPLGVARAVERSGAPSPSSGLLGLRPQDLHTVYELPTSAPSSQKIALVDAYNDLHVQADLTAYDKEFHLPECTEGNGCFKQVNQHGSGSGLPFPASEASLKAAEKACNEGSEAACVLVSEAEGWSVEISLDVESAHAVCQSCSLVLVEADSPAYSDLEAAEDSAVTLGASEVSNSWGGPECIEGECVTDTSAFYHPGVVIAAAAGDYGYLGWDAEAGEAQGYADFPASSPTVVAVGGTRLSPLGLSGKWTGETVWNGDGAGGGGCSVRFKAQPWQQALADWSSVGCGEYRAVADVSADADPYTGVVVRDASPACETAYEEGGIKHHLQDWCTIGGTSLASPIIASVYALAGGADGAAYPAKTLYVNEKHTPSSLHDVLSGSNGECDEPFQPETGLSGCTAAEEAQASCSEELICMAGAGYDGPTGVGTPDGISAFQRPVQTEEAEEQALGGRASGAPESGAGGSSSNGGSAKPLVATAPAPSPAAAVRLSGLTLTLPALIALNKNRPSMSKVAFTFTLNVAVRVQVKLEQRVGKRGHEHWKALGHTLTIAGTSGRNTRHLGGRVALSAGSYRLTLAPAGGAARSVAFKIG
jgi:Subtilase family